MTKLPEKVQETLELLRKENNHYLSAKIINDHCYIYEATSKWDKERKKVKSITRYLGRVTQGGLFIPGIKRDAELRSATIGDAFGPYEAPQHGEKKEKAEKYYSSKYEQELIGKLSLNGRMSAPKLGTLLGIKSNRIEHSLCPGTQPEAARLL
jgi:hypothetical protein